MAEIDEERFYEATWNYFDLRFLDAIGDREHIAHFRYESLSRSYLLRKIAQEFHLTPKMILECGSAGSIVPAMVFPGSRCIALDHDMHIFANEVNYLPEELNCEASYYEDFALEKQSLIDKHFPNYQRIVGNFRNIPLKRCVDLSVQFDLHYDSFTLENVRKVMTEGGHIIMITGNFSYGPLTDSFYETGEFRTEALHYPRRGKKLIAPDGMEELVVPDCLRRYEFMHRSTEKTNGYIMQIFRC